MLNDDVSIVRLNALRVVYFLKFALLAVNLWPLLISPAKPIDPMTGIAFAFFAAFSTLCALGVRYPLKMLPVLWVQLLYKSVWLLTVALPLWSARQWTPETANMVRVFVAAVIVDALVIPWPYVVATFGKAPGDPWTRKPPSSGRIGATATRVAEG
jgi:hypothetical protein